jgi:hypothetical protein
MTFNNLQDMKRRFFFFIPFMIAAAVLLFGGLVMWLWNYILPPVLGVGALTFWQAVGLLILCRILFGGFRGRPGGGPRGGGWNRRHQFRERWMKMSDEERQKFRSEWRNRCR